MKQLAGPDGGTIYRFQNGSEFTQPALDPSTRHDEPVTYFSAMLDVADEIMATTASIRADANLSVLGRDTKLDPLQAKAIETLAAGWSALDGYETHLNTRETELLKVPVIDPTHTAMAIEEREIRDWWRSQPVSERTAHLERLETEPGHHRLLLALIRSPIPLIALKVKMARDVWDRLRRLDSPDEALFIATGRTAVEWSRRGVAQTAAITSLAIGWDRPRVLKVIAKSENDRVRSGFSVYGFSRADLAAMDRVLAAEGRRRAA